MDEVAMASRPRALDKALRVARTGGVPRETATAAELIAGLSQQ
jgi:hypothetical protein